MFGLFFIEDKYETRIKSFVTATTQIGGKEIVMKSPSEITMCHHKFAWSFAVLGLVVAFTLYTAPALAYDPFQITSPAGAILNPEQPVTIQWTGGDPTWAVNIGLIDLDRNTVVGNAALSIPNSGTFAWTVPSPSSLPFDGPCGRAYYFFLGNVQSTSWTYGGGFSVVCEIPITIDIQPGSFPNSINPEKKGVVPVAILSTDIFDATSVNISTVFFGITGSEAAPVHTYTEDINIDGLPDTILYFKVLDTGIQCGDTSAFLSGQTVSGQPFEGTDSINTVRCKK